MTRNDARNRRTRFRLIVGVLIALVAIVGVGILAALSLSSPAAADISVVRTRLYDACKEAHSSVNPAIGQSVLDNTCTRWTDEVAAQRRADVVLCDTLAQTSEEFTICLLGRMIQPSVGWQ